MTAAKISYEYCDGTTQWPGKPIPATHARDNRTSIAK